MAILCRLDGRVNLFARGHCDDFSPLRPHHSKELVLSGPGSILDALFSEVARAQEEQAKAGRALLAAESAYLTEVRRAFDSGAIDPRQLQLIYNQHRDRAAITKLTALSARWLDYIPYDRHAIRMMAARVPERSDATWRGSTGLAGLGSDGPVPGKGALVAFALFGNGGTPVYIGFTAVFRNRLATLDREGLRWESWLAVACADRRDSIKVRRDLIRRFGEPERDTASETRRRDRRES